jgi:hypothetical protein
MFRKRASKECIGLLDFFREPLSTPLVPVSIVFATYLIATFSLRSCN